MIKDHCELCDICNKYKRRCVKRYDYFPPKDTDNDSISWTVVYMNTIGEWEINILFSP